jgi:hypothetical protein
VQYDEGAGFWTLNSETNDDLAGPMTVRVFLINEVNDKESLSVWFENLNIVADQIFPPLQPLVLSISSINATEVVISWPTVTNVYYQVQQASVLTTNAWVNLGQSLPGTGGTISITNEVIGQPQNYFQVLESLSP